LSENSFLAVDFLRSKKPKGIWRLFRSLFLAVDFLRSKKPKKTLKIILIKLENCSPGFRSILFAFGEHFARLRRASSWELKRGLL